MHNCLVTISPINNYNYFNKHQILKYLSSQLTQAVTCILEVPGSNLGQHTNCSDWRFFVANARTVPQNRQ
jgi:hypothetical protein